MHLCYWQMKLIRHIITIDINHTNLLPAIAVHAALALAVVHGELHNHQVRVGGHEVVDALVDVGGGRRGQRPVGKGVVLVGERVPDPLEQALPVREVGALRPHAGCARHTWAITDWMHTYRLFRFSTVSTTIPEQRIRLPYSNCGMSVSLAMTLQPWKQECPRPSSSTREARCLRKRSADATVHAAEVELLELSAGCPSMAVDE